MRTLKRSGPTWCDAVLDVALVLLCVAVAKGMKQRAYIQRAQQAELTEGLNFPVIFGPASSTDPLYCYPDDIAGCGANKTDSQSPCCTHVQSFTIPSQQVDDTQLFAATLVGPILLLLLASTLTCYCSRPNRKARRCVAEFSAAAHGFIVSFLLCAIVTEGIKRSIGMPRPNFRALSALYDFGHAHGAQHDALATSVDLGGSHDNYDWAKDERNKNVPSGHSSLGLVAGVYLTFYFSAKAQVLLPAVGAVSTRSQALRQWAVLGSFWTTAAGIWIMGALIGVASAAVGWRTCAWPYLYRIWDTDLIYGRKEKEEEEEEEGDKNTTPKPDASAV